MYTLYLLWLPCHKISALAFDWTSSQAKGTNSTLFLTHVRNEVELQAKGTNSTSFLTHVRKEVELVPLACEDVDWIGFTKLAFSHHNWLLC